MQKRRQDSQHNGIQHNDTQNNKSQYNYTQKNTRKAMLVIEDYDAECRND